MNMGGCGIMVGGIERFLIRLSYNDSSNLPNREFSSYFLEFLLDRIYLLS